MKIDKYLIIGKNGSVTIREREPRLAGNEIALRLIIDLPSALFERPIVHANITIPTEAVPTVNIDAQVTDNIEKIIKEVTGLQMVVSVIAHKENQDE